MNMDRMIGKEFETDLADDDASSGSSSIVCGCPLA